MVISNLRRDDVDIIIICTCSLGSRPSPLRRLLASVHCARAGHTENGEGLGTSREDRRKVTQRHVASTTNIKVCIRRSYRRVINARYSVVYSSLASSLFSKHKLSNGAAVPRRRATSCLPSTSCLSPRDVSSHVFTEFPAPAWPHN